MFFFIHSRYLTEIRHQRMRFVGENITHAATFCVSFSILTWLFFFFSILLVKCICFLFKVYCRWTVNKILRVAFSRACTSQHVYETCMSDAWQRSRYRQRGRWNWRRRAGGRRPPCFPAVRPPGTAGHVPVPPLPCRATTKLIPNNEVC